MICRENLTIWPPFWCLWARIAARPCNSDRSLTMMALNFAQLITPTRANTRFDKAWNSDAMAADKDKQLAISSGEDGAGDTGGKKKMAGKQLVLFIILPAILVLGGGGAATYFFVLKKPATAEAAAGDHAKAEKKKKEKKEANKGDKGGEKKAGESGVKTSEGPNGEGFMTLSDIVVNISTPDNRPAFLKLKLTLQAKDMETIEAIEPLMPRILDQYTGFLRELRMEDVAGSAGYARIQMELLKRINLAVAPAQIDAVLIEEMLVN
jgi:flagellar protein FliL